MPEQEKIDLDVTKAEIVKIKESTFEYLLMASKYTEIEMAQSGYGTFTKGEMLESILQDAEKKINRLWKAHIKKYPD